MAMRRRLLFSWDAYILSVYLLCAMKTRFAILSYDAPTISRRETIEAHSA